MTEQVTEQERKGSYKPLWWLIALCAFPYIAGTLYYQFRGALPAGESTNYGELIQPVVAVRDAELLMLDGSDRNLADFRKKWLMLYVLDGECGEDCLKNVYYMRQVRKAMAQDRFRISRLMIIDSPSLVNDELQQVLAQYPDMFVATLGAVERDRLFASLQVDGDSIYRKIMLIDPLGNLMMRYPQNPEPKQVLKDIKRLLTVSRIG